LAGWVLASVRRSLPNPVWQQRDVTELTAQVVLYKPLAIKYDTVVHFFNLQPGF
jgi:hypothetical protein